jgi:CubicO group peptidase (beta-lactamase class C family)
VAAMSRCLLVLAEVNTYIVFYSTGLHVLIRILAEYFQGLPKRPPVFSPYTTPVYSNTAYRILGYVLEAISGTSYEDTLRRSVLEPLDMNRTTASIPSNSSWGVIPPGDSLWSEDLGDEVP